MSKANGTGNGNSVADSPSYENVAVQNTRDWTVMVYFAGDDVDQHVMDNLSRLKQAGSTERVALLAMINPPGASETTQYWLENGTLLEEDVIKRSSDADIGDPKTLTDFVAWAIDNAPAKHYMLVIWGHGDGWQSEDNAGRIAGRTVRRRIDPAKIKQLLRANGVDGANVERLLDSLSLRPNRTINGANSPDVLDGQALKEALCGIHKKLGRKLDVLGMDSCLMAMIEVAYQLKDSVHYLIACEEVEPIDSWPYDRIFNQLVLHPELEPLQLGQLIVRKYMVDFKDQGRFVTQSVCDLTRADRLADAITLLAVALEISLPDIDLRTRIMSARAAAQSYYIKDYVDIYDFCDALSSLIDDAGSDLRRACEGVRSAIGNARAAVDNDGGFVRVHGFYGYPLKGSHGASIYFPCRDFSPLYSQLDFASRNAWTRFLSAYTELTGGAVRADLRPENADLVGTVHLGGHPGDGELGPGDPILIPEDPISLHPIRRGRRSLGESQVMSCPSEAPLDEISSDRERASNSSRVG